VNDPRRERSEVTKEGHRENILLEMGEVTGSKSEEKGCKLFGGKAETSHCQKTTQKGREGAERSGKGKRLLKEEGGSLRTAGGG